jgi:hypothetical protein
MKLEFTRQIFERQIQIRNFMKIRVMGAEFLHAGGQTQPEGLDQAKHFSQFCERA